MSDTKQLLTAEEERNVVQAVLDGDKEQYARIIKAYQQIVVNLIYKIAGDSLDVEELAQQVFVELYTSLPRFRFESRLSTFIYSITVNVVNKTWSRNKRYVSFDVDFSETLKNLHNEEAQIVKEEQRVSLYNAIGKLKPEQRTALVLYTFEDFSYQEIADIMQVSLAKVETLIFRSKKKLKQFIEATEHI